MTCRRAYYFVAAFVVLLGNNASGALEEENVPSWYYSSGRYDGVNILVTCEAGTTIFRSISFSFDTPVKEHSGSDAEVAMACRLREKLLEEGFFGNVSFFGFNDVMFGLVGRQNNCNYCRDLNEEQAEQCRQTYYSAIDWMLDNEADIDAGQLSKTLALTIQELNEEMFYFLLSRGADPHYVPPQIAAYANADEELKALVDTVPKSAAELLELHMARLDKREFPDTVAAWKRMLLRANNSGAAQ